MKRLYLTIITLLTITIASATDYTLKNNLPCIYIDTENSQKIISKSNYIYATLRYVDEQGTLTQYDSLKIRGRGNSTWNSMTKKSYRIKFNQKEKFLGKGFAKAKSWTLLANAADKTLMRNALTSAIGEFTSLKFNPAHKFVDLVLNGTYQGTYQISDQMEVRKKRVDIEEQDEELTDSSNITGGYLLEVDGFADYTPGVSGFKTSKQKVPVNIHYPDDDVIQSSQYSYIRSVVQNFEDKLFSSSFKDPEEGYRPLVDTMSLIDWYICTEVSANIDGFYSSYFYKDRDDEKLYWGPLWDYDIAYGNDTRKGDTSESLMADVGYGTDTGCRTWIEQMWKDKWFKQAVYNRYVQLMKQNLLGYVVEKIDSLSRLLDESQQLNYEKWGISTRAYHERVIYSSYTQYVNDLTSFCKTHLPYLTKTFKSRLEEEEDEEEEDTSGPFSPDTNYYYYISNAGTGTVIDIENQQPASASMICGWQRNSTYETQNWRFQKQDDYWMIYNESGLALNDPTMGYSDATTGTGRPLEVAEANTSDERQHWTINRVGDTDKFNIINRYTDHCANLSGGSSANGTHILSYTNDSRNQTSTNRQWTFNKSRQRRSTEINSPEPQQYALAYDKNGRRLHFGSQTPELLTFTCRIYNTSGSLIATFNAAEGFSTAALSNGTYIVAWKAGEKARSCKLVIE